MIELIILNNDRKTITLICDRLIDRLISKRIKYIAHRFDQAVMIDVWVADSLYVVQIEENLIGLSKIDSDNPGFDTIPDEKFFNEKEFNLRFEALISLV